MPCGESINLSAVLTGSSHKIDTSLFCGIEEGLQIPESLEGDFTLLRLQNTPEHIERHRIKAH